MSKIWVERFLTCYRYKEPCSSPGELQDLKLPFLEECLLKQWFSGIIQYKGERSSTTEILSVSPRFQNVPSPLDYWTEAGSSNKSCLQMIFPKLVQLNPALWRWMGAACTRTAACSTQRPWSNLQIANMPVAFLHLSISLSIRQNIHIPGNNLSQSWPLHPPLSSCLLFASDSASLIHLAYKYVLTYFHKLEQNF